MRLAVAFLFGLFHGLGFAGGLLQLMHVMPTSLLWFAILGFSLGVQAGNQLILLPLYGVLQWFTRRKHHLKDNSPVNAFQCCASGAVAIAGVYDQYMAFKI